MSKTKLYISLLLFSITILTGCLTNTDSDDNIHSIQIIISECIADEEFSYLRIREAGSSVLVHNDKFEHSVGTWPINFRQPLVSDTTYDIQLETKDQRFALTSLKLTQNMLVQFEREHFMDDTALEVTRLNIRNLTGTDFGVISIRRTDNVGGWLFQRTASFSNDTTVPIQNIDPPLSTTYRYDIQLRERATGGISATLLNQSLTNNRTLRFDDSD